MGYREEFSEAYCSVAGGSNMTTGANRVGRLPTRSWGGRSNGPTRIVGSSLQISYPPFKKRGSAWELNVQQRAYVGTRHSLSSRNSLVFFPAVTTRMHYVVTDTSNSSRRYIRTNMELNWLDVRQSEQLGNSHYELSAVPNRTVISHVLRGTLYGITADFSGA